MLQGAVGTYVEAQNTTDAAHLRITEGVYDGQVEAAREGAQVQVTGYPRLKSLRPAQLER